MEAGSPFNYREDEELGNDAEIDVFDEILDNLACNLLAKMENLNRVQYNKYKTNSFLASQNKETIENVKIGMKDFLHDVVIEIEE